MQKYLQIIFGYVFSFALCSAAIMVITACTHTCCQRAGKCRVCMGVQTGFCGGSC